MNKTTKYDQGYALGYERGKEQYYTALNAAKSRIGILEKKINELAVLDQLVKSLATVNDAIAHAITAIKR